MPRHYFNNIDYTKWPFLISIWVFFVVYFLVLFLNKYVYVSIYFLLGSFFGLVVNIYNWFHDMVIESTFLGRYNKKVRSSLVFGFFLFLISEIMLFSGFFWSFFDRIFHLSIYTFSLSYLNGFELIQWYNIPLVATFVLLTSGYIFNVSYYYLRLGLFFQSDLLINITLLLAYIFLVLQYIEYTELTFSISDSVYSSLFFLLTGFHGMHVLVGTIFIGVSASRFEDLHFSNTRNLCFVLSLIYWHFVDIIWIFLFIFIYFLNNYNIFATSTSVYGDTSIITFNF